MVRCGGRADKRHSRAVMREKIARMTTRKPPLNAIRAFVAAAQHQNFTRAAVELRDAPKDGGWPTRQAIDEEVAFVRGILTQDGLNIDDDPKKFNWGEAWSSFDAKGFLASNGLRYRLS